MKELSLCLILDWFLIDSWLILKTSWKSWLYFKSKIIFWNLKFQMTFDETVEYILFDSFCPEPTQIYRNLLFLHLNMRNLGKFYIFIFFCSACKYTLASRTEKSKKKVTIFFQFFVVENTDQEKRRRRTT